MAVNRCSKCATANASGSRFCTSCGIALMSEPVPAIGHKSAEERKQLLARQIQTEIVGGGRIESQGDYMAVVIRGHRVNHVLHFLIGVVTCGFWWLAWIILGITGGEKRRVVSVDEFGNVTVQRDR